jgi:IS5 family transposase
VNDLTDLLEATRRIGVQTRQRLSGTIPDGATGQVSLHDADARPIAKGRLGKPVEFGYKAQVSDVNTDNDDGVVLDHSVERGNPPDSPQLAPAIRRVTRRTRRRPRTVTADRGEIGDQPLGSGGDLHASSRNFDVGASDQVHDRLSRPNGQQRSQIWPDRPGS